jgi:hypothetical protein
MPSIVVSLGSITLPHEKSELQIEQKRLKNKELKKKIRITNKQEKKNKKKKRN